MSTCLESEHVDQEYISYSKTINISYQSAQNFTYKIK